MNAHGPDATVADEESAVVDDAQVIDKTLPSKQPLQPASTLMECVDQALDPTRDFVRRQPIQSMMIVAAASSVLTMLLTRRTFDGDA
jgi:hypothetical protein